MVDMMATPSSWRTMAIRPALSVCGINNTQINAAADAN